MCVMGALCRFHAKYVVGEWIKQLLLLLFLLVSSKAVLFVFCINCYIELPMLITLDTIGDATSLIEILVYIIRLRYYYSPVCVILFCTVSGCLWALIEFFLN